MDPKQNFYAIFVVQMCQQMLRAKHQLTMSVFNNPDDEQSWNADCTAVSGTMQNVLLTVSERARCNVLFYDSVNMRRVSE